MKTKFLKKPVAIILVVVVMICISTFTALAVNEFFPSISSIVQTAAEKNGNNAIFDYDGIVYKYDDETGRISSIGKTGLPKYGPALSPDDTRIAYRNSVIDTPNSALQVGIMDMDGKILCAITIQSISSNDILGLQWLDNNKIAVTGHVNPSTSECFIFDAETGKELSRYIGYAFTSLPDGTGVIYAKNVPHGFGHLAYHSLKVNDEVVFTAEDMGTSFRSLIFSQDERNVAFILRPDDRNLPSKVVLAEYNKEDHGIKQLSEVDIPENIGGVLSFDEIGNVCFFEETTKHTLSKESGKFTSTDVLMDMRDAALDSKQYDKFRDDVSKQFGSGALEDIFDITWIR